MVHGKKLSPVEILVPFDPYAIVQLMDTIASATDANLITATVSMDLSVAFDCVNHSTLNDKYYGLDGNTMRWIASYLEFRSSIVEIGSARSNIKSAPYGVPQGFVWDQYCIYYT